MKDSILAGTGNSRYLKTSLSADITWQRALELLRAGTFPVDFNGTNPNGYTQVGTPLNKANLLTDATAAKMDLTSTATVNDFLDAVADKVNTGTEFTVDEVETGSTWVDGKSIYRRVVKGEFTKNSVSTTQTQTLVSNFSGYDTIISLGGTLKVPTGLIAAIPFGSTYGLNECIGLYAYSSSININFGSKWGTGKYTYTVIVDYTKTST